MTTSETPPEQLGTDAMNSDLGERLKHVREERGLTQSAVANRSKMIDPNGRGISRTSVLGYEQGTSQPGLREIRLLCEVLRVTPNWLVYGADAVGSVQQASMEFFSINTQRQLQNVIRASLALIALKGHERDSILSLVLSLSGRQLGDLRLSGLLLAGQFISDKVMEDLRAWVPNITEETSLEEIAEAISVQQGGNIGNRLQFDPEDPSVLIGGQWTYPDPKQKKSEN